MKTIPELVRKLGAIKFGPEWNKSAAWKYFPSFGPKENIKHRWQRKVSFDGKKYKLEKKELSVPSEDRQLVETFAKQYLTICDEIRIAIEEGTLTGTIGQQGLEPVVLSNYQGILTSQRNTVFCTGFIGIGRPSAKVYGLIRIDPKSERNYLLAVVKSMSPPQKITNLSDAQKADCRKFVEVMMSEIVEEFGDRADKWPLFIEDEPAIILMNVVGGFIGAQNQNGQDRIVSMESHPPAGGYKSSGISYSQAGLKKLVKEIFNRELMAKKGHVIAEDMRRNRALDFLRKYNFKSNVQIKHQIKRNQIEH